MARPIAPKPVGDHLTTLTRMLKQVKAAPDNGAEPSTIPPAVKRRISEKLGELMTEFQTLLTKR